MTNSIADIAQARCILAIGTNTSANHPVIGTHVRRAVMDGASLIVANPIQIPMARYAQLFLQHRPGTDLALIMGIARVIGSVVFAVVIGLLMLAYAWAIYIFRNREDKRLGSILMLAVDSAQAWRGALLLGVYSLGLGIPFLVVALTLGRVRPLLDWLNRRALVINRVAGVVLIVLGVLIASGRFAQIVGVLSNVIPKVGG